MVFFFLSEWDSEWKSCFIKCGIKVNRWTFCWMKNNYNNNSNNNSKFQKTSRRRKKRKSCENIITRSTLEEDQGLKYCSLWTEEMQWFNSRNLCLLTWASTCHILTMLNFKKEQTQVLVGMLCLVLWFVKFATGSPSGKTPWP